MLGQEWPAEAEVEEEKEAEEEEEGGVLWATHVGVVCGGGAHPRGVEVWCWGPPTWGGGVVLWDPPMWGWLWR